MPKSAPTIVLIASAPNLASQTIKAELVEKHGFRSTNVDFKGRAVYQNGSLLLVTMEEEIIRPPDLDQYFNPQAYIFLSSHRATSGIPSLTAHTTGNFGDAKLGGNPKELARADPNLLKNYLIALSKRRDRFEGYNLTVEGTHHGPTALQKPVLFVELGSSEENWSDRRAANLIAEALVESLVDQRDWEKVGIGFGGTHYSEKFNKLLIEGDLSLASIAPRYALEDIDEKMFGQILQRSTKVPRYAVCDWKGMGRQKENILALASQFGLEVLRV